MCALSAEDASTADARDTLASTCRTIAVAALSKHADHREMKAEIATTLRMMEIYGRRTGQLSDFVSVLQASTSQDAGCLALRLALACVDLQDSRALAPLDVSRMDAPADEKTVLSALTSILKGDCLVYRGRRLVRMQPWNPFAYAYAAFELLAQALLHTEAPSSADEVKETLRRAEALAESGVRVADASESASSLAVVVLRWVQAFISRHNGDDNTAASTVKDAIHCLKASKQSASEQALWEARLLSLVDSSSSLDAYQRALNQARGSTASSLLPLLIEIAGQLEAWGYLNSALHVWKVLSGLWKQDAQGGDEAPSDDTLNVPSFVSSLRLALLNGKAQNGKWAKKFCKSATAALAPADETSAAARVTHFVENVIATKL
ncbi:hypothetical protein PINS_up000500 [Pythium insidiosum]|nr:hypothetical protein PINS_up000500 [Pythium insidiosum]